MEDMSRFTLKKFNGRFIVTRGLSIRKEFKSLSEAWQYIFYMREMKDRIRRAAV